MHAVSYILFLRRFYKEKLYLLLLNMSNVNKFSRGTVIPRADILNLFFSFIIWLLNLWRLAAHFSPFTSQN